jgi:hypothetical protein
MGLSLGASAAGESCQQGEAKGMLARGRRQGMLHGHASLEV